MLRSLKAYLPRLNFVHDDAQAPIASAKGRCELSQQDVPQVFRVEALKSLDLYEVTIDDLRQYLADGRLTSVDYVDFCLQRIRRVCGRFTALSSNYPLHPP